MNSYLEVWTKYAEFSGRASRSEFWIFHLLNLIIVTAIGFVESRAGSPGVIGLLFSLAVLTPSLAVGTRRLQDTGRSGWWQLLVFIPLIGGLVLIVWWAQESAVMPRPGQTQDSGRLSERRQTSGGVPTIKFVNEKVTVEAREGEDIRSVARRNGVQLYSGPHKVVNCMGFGACCSCNIVVKDGTENCSPKGILEKINKWINPLLGLKLLSNPEKDVRLACQTKVHGDVEVETNPPVNWHGDKFWN